MLRLGVERACSGLARQSLAAWQQVRGVKDSTYLTGLPVDPEADRSSVGALSELLRESSDQLPEGSAYRRSVEAYATSMLAVINGAGSQEAAEAQLGRQLEEITLDCYKELELIQLMAQWKPWEAPADHHVRVFADLKNLPDNVKAFRAYQEEVVARQ